MMQFVWLIFGFKTSSYKSEEIELILNCIIQIFIAKSCYSFAIYTFRLVESYQNRIRVIQIVSYKLLLVRPAGIYLLKIDNKNTRKKCKICSKLTIKTPKRHHWTYLGLYKTFMVTLVSKVVSSWNSLTICQKISKISIRLLKFTPKLPSQVENFGLIWKASFMNQLMKILITHNQRIH